MGDYIGTWDWPFWRMMIFFGLIVLELALGLFSILLEVVIYKVTKKEDEKKNRRVAQMIVYPILIVLAGLGIWPVWTHSHKADLYVVNKSNQDKILALGDKSVVIPQGSVRQLFCRMTPEGAELVGKSGEKILFRKKIGRLEYMVNLSDGQVGIKAETVSYQSESLRETMKNLPNRPVGRPRDEAKSHWENGVWTIFSMGSPEIYGFQETPPSSKSSRSDSEEVIDLQMVFSK